MMVGVFGKLSRLGAASQRSCKSLCEKAAVAVGWSSRSSWCWLICPNCCLGRNGLSQGWFSYNETVVWPNSSFPSCLSCLLCTLADPWGWVCWEHNQDRRAKRLLALVAQLLYAELSCILKELCGKGALFKMEGPEHMLTASGRVTRGWKDLYLQGQSPARPWLFPFERQGSLPPVCSSGRWVRALCAYSYSLCMLFICLKPISCSLLMLEAGTSKKWSLDSAHTLLP